jgi:excisionase family DNA binding protein
VIIVTDSLLSVKDVAEWLKISERTVFNLIDRKEISGAKVGNRWRFDPEEIRAYLARQQQHAQQEGSAA